MTLWIILIILLSAFFLFILLPTVLVFFAVFRRKKALPYEQMDREKFKNHYYVKYLDRVSEERKKIQSHKHSAVNITSYDGLKLYGDYYDQSTDRTVILFHGLGAEMYTNCSSQAEFFYNRGFNVLIICERAHGISEGNWTTIGIKEQYDVLSWIQWAKQHGSKQILLYGLSMGAAALAHSSDKLDDPCIRCIVLDSCYYSIYEQMRHDTIKNHIPKILLFTLRVMGKLFLGIDTKTATVEALAYSKKPVLVIHGTNDETVEPKWSKIIFDSCSSPKEYLLVEGGPHTLNYLHDPELTGQALISFLDKYFTD